MQSFTTLLEQSFLGITLELWATAAGILIASWIVKKSTKNDLTL